MQDQHGRPTNGRRIITLDTLASPTRRRLLRQLGGATAAAAFLPTLGRRAWALGAVNTSTLFTLGVASGDPGATSVVLWTRLAPNPLNGGGMGNSDALVTWEVATDPAMTEVIRGGQVSARAADGHAVNVPVSGLLPDSWYYYRFTHGGETSRIGRTRTFPAVDAMPGELRFALASCQDYEAGYYAAWRDMLSQDLDLVVFVGDYIYEYAASAAVPAERRHVGAEITSVADYRNRYALYRLDADLQNAHASFPFICTPDDHEVDNNYAGLIPEDAQTPDAFRQRRANAYKVYRESMPMLPGVQARAARMDLFRRLRYGRLVDFHVLDTRQYRSDQICGDGLQIAQTCPDIANPTLTVLGTRQERWLYNNLKTTDALWNVLAQQVMMMRWDLGVLTGSPGINLFNVDAWDGYQVARNRIMQFLGTQGISNPIVLTGDIHSAWAADLKSDFTNPNAPVVGSEFVCSSITSTFGDSNASVVQLSLPSNPHIRYFDGLHRGYALCSVDASRWLTEFRGVTRVADPVFTVPSADLPLTTLRAFAVNVGQPGLVPVI